jgi:NADH-quinone oxidoreductase subunit G
VLKSAAVVTDGDGTSTSAWAAILNHIRTTFAQHVAASPAGVVGVFSPWMTCEDAYLLASWLRSLSSGVRLAMGPVPIVGEDDHYPKNWRGEPANPTRFTIRAEKCPNRRGVAAVLRHFQSEEVPFDDVLEDATSGALKAAYVAHNGPGVWLNDSQIQSLMKTQYLVVQDILSSRLTDLATVVLPGASFAEKDGTFVNHAGLAQMIKRAIRCPAEGYTDGRIFMELAGRSGLFNARVVRQEMSGVIPYFAPLAVGDLGLYGVRLEQPAGVAAMQEQLAR